MQFGAIVKTGCCGVLIAGLMLPVMVWANQGAGTPADPYHVPEVDVPIDIDGRLSEQVWETALKISLPYEVSPGENIPAPVETEVLLVYDRSALYAGFRCDDPDPNAICASITDRDNLDSAEDWVGLILDTFNDERRSFGLLVNPMGVQDDFIETETGSVSWDGIWESAGSPTAHGYSVELRLPFNQLCFQRTDGPQIWGFDAVRRYPRLENHHLGTFPRDRNNNCYLCQALKIEGFDGVSPGRSVEFNPTVTAVRSDLREAFPEGDFVTDHKEVEFGVTGQWGITPFMTMSATINPDFSQVEADALQLDVNQPFALWFAERRPFFTEGGDFFSTLKSAVYTRTMRDPDWGLKLTGKQSGNTVAVYTVRDDLTNLIFPGSEGSASTSLPTESIATVGRYKRDIGSGYTLGALLTHRAADDYENSMASLDANMLLTRRDQIQLQLMGSQTTYPDQVAAEFNQPEGKLSDTFLAFEYDHESRTWGWWLDYDQVGEDFRADLGFIPRVGFRNVEGGLHRRWQAEPGRWWTSVRLGTEYNYYETDEGVPLDRGSSFWLSYSGQYHSSLYIQGSRYLETYEGREFDLGGLYVSGGFRPSHVVWLSFVTRYGERLDYANVQEGERFYVSPYAGFTLGRHLRFGLDYAYEHMDVPNGRLYRAHLGELRAHYSFNVRCSLLGVLQYSYYALAPALYPDESNANKNSEHLFGQGLFRYMINARTVLFIGYNGSHYGADAYDLTAADRTLFAKIGYALGL
ncbi:DUF5916 domain-containing protein [Candidatus Eisenbacteria bacterium]|uniref:DUF5916 domain-containing protein n=1 Tax=Eiseniibacteriota bacterium TaxID=2212470 RepID=A0ABV6YLD2_UNCEI